VLPGDKLAFTITVANRGGTTAQDVVVTDKVPDVFHVVDLTSEKGAIVVEHQTVTAYIVSLAPAEVVHLRVAVAVSGDAQPNSRAWPSRCATAPTSPTSPRSRPPTAKSAT